MIDDELEHDYYREELEKALRNYINEIYAYTPILRNQLPQELIDMIFQASDYRIELTEKKPSI